MASNSYVISDFDSAVTQQNGIIIQRNIVANLYMPALRINNNATSG
ncbi:hypothetical protein ACYJL1_21230 (plasmid) [Phyllobacterium sp. K27]